MRRSDIRKNGSGYRDDTAFKAICNVTRASRRNRNGISAVKIHRIGGNGIGADPVDSRAGKRAIKTG